MRDTGSTRGIRKRKATQANRKSTRSIVRTPRQHLAIAPAKCFQIYSFPPELSPTLSLFSPREKRKSYIVFAIKKISSIFNERFFLPFVFESLQFFFFFQTTQEKLLEKQNKGILETERKKKRKTDTPEELEEVVGEKLLCSRPNGVDR